MDMEREDKGAIGGLTALLEDEKIGDCDEEEDLRSAFRTLLTQFGGRARMGELVKQRNLFPECFFERDWLRKHTNKFMITEKKGFIEYVSVFVPHVRLCVHYNNRKKCFRQDCDYFHICCKFVTKSCKPDLHNCTLSHNFYDKRNAALVAKMGLTDLQNKQIAKIVRRCHPEVCKDYANGNVHAEKTCPDLHVCDLFPCTRGAACQLEHTCLSSQHNIRLLNCFHIGHLKEKIVSKMILCRNSEINATDPKADCVKSVHMKSTGKKIDERENEKSEKAECLNSGWHQHSGQSNRSRSCNETAVLTKENKDRKGHEITSVGDQEKDVQDAFRTLLTKFNGRAKLEDLLQYETLFPAPFFNIAWLKKHKDKFTVFEKNGSVEHISVYFSEAKLCYSFNGPDGCTIKECKYFHVCCGFVTESCKPHLQTCRRSHNFYEKDSAVHVGKVCLDEFKNKQIAKIVRCTVPEVCKEYTQGHPHDEETCPYLHVCDLFPCIRGSACQLEHTCLSTEHNRWVSTCLRTGHFKELTLQRMIIGRASQGSVQITGTQQEDQLKREDRTPIGRVTDKQISTDTYQDDSNTLDAQNVFEIMLTRFGGRARLNDLRNHTDIFPESFLTTSNLRKHKNRFAIFENNETIEHIATYLRGARVCVHYNSDTGCTNSKCQYFHICSGFVTEQCHQINDQCMRSHDFFDSHNIQVVKGLHLQEFKNIEIAKLVRCSSPEICQEYNQGKVHDEAACPYLHICYQYPRCNLNSCQLEHICLTSAHNVKILETFRIAHFKEGYLERVILGRRGPMDHKSQQILKVTAKDVSKTVSREAGGTVKKHPLVTPVPSIADGQYLCEVHIWDVCRNQTRCSHYHGYQSVPYQWQTELNQKWHDFTELLNETIEEVFCDPESSDHSICLNGLDLDMDFISMIATLSKGKRSIGSVRIRRLSTMSYSEGKGTLSKLTLWCWYWRNDHSFVMYDPASVSYLIMPQQQYSLEKKYLHGQEEYLFERGTFPYKMTIKRNQKMIQQNMVTGTKRLVVRRPLFVSMEHVQAKKTPSDTGLLLQCPQDTYKIPLDWAPLDLVQPFELVSLEADSGTYLDVKRSFHFTLPETRYVITAIFRVQNPSMWDRHCCHKRSIDHTAEKEGLLDGAKEKMLFHGTDTEEVVKGICVNGFDFRVCGKNGTAYGRGAYFARKAHYSNSYTNRKGKRFMFRARVMVGQYTQGRPELTRPPSRRGHLLYDSCVDDVDQPSIFVTFHQDQAYPEFFIEYVKKEKDTVLQTAFGKSPSKLTFAAGRAIISPLSHKINPTTMTVSATPTLNPVSTRSTLSSASTSSTPSSVTAQPSPSSVSARSTPSSASAQSTPSFVTGWSTPSSVTGRSTPSSVSAQPTPSSVSARSTPSSVTGRSTLSSATAQPTPSSVSARSTPSSISAQSALSSVTARSTPSSATTRPIPSSVTARSTSSSVSAQSTPSFVTGWSTPSSVTGRSTPSSVSAQPTPSSVSARSTPSSVTGRSTLSSATAQPTPSSVSARSTPSSVSARSTPSSVSARSTPSSVSAQPTPISVTARSTPSSATTRPIPSSVTARSTSSSVSAQSTPSFVTGWSTPSSVTGRSTPSSVSAQPTPSSVSARSTPSSVTGRSTLSSATAQPTPSSVSARSTPSSVSAQSTPSSVSARSTLSSLRAQPTSSYVTAQSTPISVRARPIPSIVCAQSAPNSVTAHPAPTSVRTQLTAISVRALPTPTSFTAQPIQSYVSPQPIPNSVSLQPIPTFVRTQLTPISVSERPMPTSVKPQPILTSIRTQLTSSSVRALPAPNSGMAQPIQSSVSSQPIPNSIITHLTSNSIRVRPPSSSVNKQIRTDSLNAKRESTSKSGRFNTKNVRNLPDNRSTRVSYTLSPTDIAIIISIITILTISFPHIMFIIIMIVMIIIFMIIGHP